MPAYSTSREHIPLHDITVIGFRRITISTKTLDHYRVVYRLDGTCLSEYKERFSCDDTPPALTSRPKHFPAWIMLTWNELEASTRLGGGESVLQVSYVSFDQTTIIGTHPTLTHTTTFAPL